MQDLNSLTVGALTGLPAPAGGTGPKYLSKQNICFGRNSSSNQNRFISCSNYSSNVNLW